MMEMLLNNIEIIIALGIAIPVTVKAWNFVLRKKKLRKMAELLGLEFSVLPLDKQAESELAEMKDKAWAPWLQKLISLFAPWEMKGRFQGMPARVSRRFLVQRVYGRGTSHRERKDAFMRIEISFHENLGLGLQIFSENPFVRLGHDGFDDRRTELQSGNPELDSRLRINGISEERIVRLLSRTDLREALLQLFGMYSNAVVDDESVRVEEPGIMVNANDCRARLEALTRVASSIDRAIRFV